MQMVNYSIVHQVGADGNNPQISTMLDINEQKRYSYTFKTADVPRERKFAYSFTSSQYC